MMRRELKIKGTTPDQKLDHVERILQRLQRRMNKVVIGVIPPVFVPAYVQHPMDDGKLMSWLIPLDGKLVRGMILVRRYNTDKGVMFHCRVDRKEGGVFQDFETRKSVAHVIEFDLEVKMGDVVTVSVDEPIVEPKPGTAEEPKWVVEDINISFLLEVVPGENTTKQFLLDELLAVTEGQLEEE